MDNNNLYQVLMQTQTIIKPIIRTLSPSKDNQTVTEQQPAPPPDVTKASEILPMPRDDEMGQHNIPINK